MAKPTHLKAVDLVDLIGTLKVYIEDFSWNSSTYEKTYYNSNHDIHRIDGPAIESCNQKYNKWIVNGRLHRIGGPAWYDSYDSYDHYYEWRINGKQVEIYYIYG